MELEQEQKQLIYELARTIPNIAETLNENLEVLKAVVPTYDRDKTDLSRSALHEQVAALNMIYIEVRLIESYLHQLMPDYKPRVRPDFNEPNPRRNAPGGYPKE